MYLCQWAPAAWLGFLLVTFGTVGALTSFEFSESGLAGPPPLNTQAGWAEKSETQELPPKCRHAYSFRILSWNSASRPLHKFVQVFDTLKIPVQCFGTRDTLKKVICPSVSQALCILLCHFHMNLIKQNSWPNWSSTNLWQFSTCNRFHGKD